MTCAGKDKAAFVLVADRQLDQCRKLAGLVVGVGKENLILSNLAAARRPIRWAAARRVP